MLRGSLGPSASRGWIPRTPPNREYTGIVSKCPIKLQSPPQDSGAPKRRRSRIRSLPHAAGASGRFGSRASPQQSSAIPTAAAPWTSSGTSAAVASPGEGAPRPPTRAGRAGKLRYRRVLSSSPRRPSAGGGEKSRRVSEPPALWRDGGWDECMVGSLARREPWMGLMEM